ncbi:MAG: DUF3109 family protein [Flavobacteriales bacterium]|nr:DUF3109 family protein [Flavobacteriales bacterium]
MIIHQNTLISNDLFDEFFACDIQKCKGACCIEGDKGAPISTEEIKTIERILPLVLEELSDESIEHIKEENFYELDDDGEYVTTCLPDGKCCFVVEQPNGILSCGIENAFYKKKIDFLKPISCHLYPVRLKEFESYTALNYHQWYLCKDACSKGLSNQIKVFEFAESALRRKFGDEWYEELKQINNDLNR